LQHPTSSPIDQEMTPISLHNPNPGAVSEDVRWLTLTHRASRFERSELFTGQSDQYQQRFCRSENIRQTRARTDALLSALMMNDTF
jgi:hypothetical protein